VITPFQIERGISAKPPPSLEEQTGRA